MQFMNKTYLIFTLILLSACSQPKYDGFWHDGEYGDDVSVKISGNVFEFFELGEYEFTCTILSPNESSSDLDCNVIYIDRWSIKVDGNNLTIYGGRDFNSLTLTKGTKK